MGKKAHRAAVGLCGRALEENMSSRSIGCCIFGIFFLCCVPVAAADAPSTQPAGPKDAFKQFAIDLWEGDSDDLANLCIAKQDDSRALVQEFQAIATAIRHLKAASAKKFGLDSVEMVMPQMATPDSVDGMMETDQADKALLSGFEAGSIQMVKSDGQWKLNMDWLRHSPELPSSGDYFKQLAQAIQRTADDISGGRLGSPQAAVEALRARQDGIPDGSAATEPTTQP
jgi:hypothetical protein